MSGVLHSLKLARRSTVAWHGGVSEWRSVSVSVSVGVGVGVSVSVSVSVGVCGDCIPPLLTHFVTCVLTVYCRVLIDCLTSMHPRYCRREGDQMTGVQYHDTPAMEAVQSPHLC